MLTIYQRPFAPEDRSEGWALGRGPHPPEDQRSASGTLVERTTRIMPLLHLGQRDGETRHEAPKTRMPTCGKSKLRSITWDQETEMAIHLNIDQSLGARSTPATPGRPGSAAPTRI